MNAICILRSNEIFNRAQDMKYAFHSKKENPMEKSWDISLHPINPGRETHYSFLCHFKIG